MLLLWLRIIEDRPRGFRGPTDSNLAQLAGLFNMHRGSITENLGDADADFGGVIPDSDHGIGAQLPRMRDHLIERLVSSPFTQGGIQRNIAAKNTLEAGSNVADDRS